MPTKFDPQAAYKRASSRLSMTVHGSTKSGKTHFVTRVPRPLYIVFLDPNANLDAHLLQSINEGFTGDIETLVVPPREYQDITQDLATKTVDEIEQFARDSRGNKKPGTFVIDGSKILKGYYEKAIVGESATLGFRPRKGQRAPAQVEYAKSNDAIRSLIAGFGDSQLDLLMTWEDKPEWLEGRDEHNNKTFFRTGNTISTMPDNIPYAIQAQIQLLRARRERFDAKTNKKEAYVEREIVFEWNSFSDALFYRRMPTVDFATVKQVLLGSIPNVESQLIPRDEALVIVSTEKDLA